MTDWRKAWEQLPSRIERPGVVFEQLKDDGLSYFRDEDDDWCGSYYRAMVGELEVHISVRGPCDEDYETLKIRLARNAIDMHRKLLSAAKVLAPYLDKEPA